MRTAIVTALVVFIASPALAENGPGKGGGGGGNHKNFATLNIVNQCDGAVAVTLNGQPAGTLEPGQSTGAQILAVTKGNHATATVGATLVGTPVSATNSARIRSGKSAIATITAPTPSSLAIGFSGEGLAKLGRETAVVLASGGGLMPLLWFGFLLARRPRRREELVDGQARAPASIPS